MHGIYILYKFKSIFTLYPGCLFQEEHQTLQMIIHIVGPFHLIMLQLTHTKMQQWVCLELLNVGTLYRKIIVIFMFRGINWLYLLITFVAGTKTFIRILHVWCSKKYCCNPSPCLFRPQGIKMSCRLLNIPSRRVVLSWYIRLLMTF